MDNQEIIKKVNEWQQCPYTHELTCRVDHCLLSLKAIEKENKVILKCMNPHCNYEQTYIPEVVLNTNIKELKKNCDKMINDLKKGKTNVS